MSTEAQSGAALRAEVEAQGQQRVEAIRREAAARIADLRSQEEAALARKRSKALRGEEAELRSVLALELSRARADGQRRVLEARDVLLGKVYAHARELLTEAIEGPAAGERLVTRAREAMGFVPAGGAVISCSPGVAAMLEEELEEDEDLRIETRQELPVGFQITAAGGAVVVDGTLEKLLELERPALSIEVLRQLEAEAP